jgi:nitrite reductase (NO-forming)
MKTRTHRNLILTATLLLVAGVALAGCMDAPDNDEDDPPAATAPDARRVASLSPDPVAPGLMEPDEDGIVRIELTTTEVIGPIADGVEFHAWTFDDTVPGPMLRVKEGDTVEITLTNAADSQFIHSIDLHAVTGPGGGAEATQAPPGESKSFRFKAMNPGLYVYHCATAHVPTHVANGMYGLILVEPAEGLPEVDKEFYVVQGEWYTQGGLRDRGYQAFSHEKMLDERPTYVVFNGAVGALTGDGALQAEVGDSVRIYFGVGGFVISSFHVIGEIFDRVYPEGGFPPNENVQTTLVPAGGATMVEFDLEVPGTYVLVDHTLTRAIDRGAAGHLIVTGDENPEVFEEL